MNKIAAGLLMYRKSAQGRDKLEVFLVHPGGPFFAKRDDVWGIPKGLVHENDKDLLETAKREFSEETGIILDDKKEFIELGFSTYNNGKVVHAWAFEDGTFDPKTLVSNLTEQGWPEVDKGEYFDLETAKKKIYEGQKDILENFEKII